MPPPKTPGSSTSSVPASDVGIGLRQVLNSSALPISLQSVSRRVSDFGASTVHTFATACQFACPPCTDPTDFPAVGDFYFWASGRSVTLPASRYNYSSDWTPLLVGLSPTGMAASLAAQFVLTPIVEEQRLGVPLALIIARTHAGQPGSHCPYIPRAEDAHSGHRRFRLSRLGARDTLGV